MIDINLKTEHMSRSRKMHLALFDDEAESYTGPTSAWGALTCEERMKHAKEFETVDWTRASWERGQQVVFYVRQRLRPRWWYVALLDCSGDDIEVEYTIRLTNPSYGWAAEFSTDRRYTLHVWLALAAAYAALAAADSASGKAAHPFTRLLAAGVLLALGEAVCSVAHNIRYAQDGRGEPLAFFVAQLCGVSSGFVLASMLLLVSQGKCVSYVMVGSDAWRMCQLLGPFLASCLVLELWGEYSLTRNYTTDYVYTTPFGWALILVDLVLLGYYGTTLRRTAAAEHGSEESRFYQTWGLVYGLWFLALPVTAVLAQVILAPYVWFIVSLSVKKGVTALVYSSLVIGLWPGNTRTYFKLRQTADDVCRTPEHSWRPARGGIPVGGHLPGLLGHPTQPLAPVGKQHRTGRALAESSSSRSICGMSP